jgi:hypothetical protein
MMRDGGARNRSVPSEHRQPLLAGQRFGEGIFQKSIGALRFFGA